MVKFPAVSVLPVRLNSIGCPMIRRSFLAGLVAFVSIPTVARSAPDVVSWGGEYADDRSPGAMVIRDADDWTMLWKRMLRASPPRPIPPGHVGLVIRLGPRRTGGYGLEILRHASRECAYYVTYAEHVPEPGAFVTQAFTQPWVIALIPAGEQPVALEREEKDGSRRIVIPEQEGRRLAQGGEACAGKLRQP